MRVRIVCEPTAGEYIGDCVRQAVLLAIQEEREVTFVHNGKRYTTSPSIVGKAVYATEELVKEAV